MSIPVREMHAESKGPPAAVVVDDKTAEVQKTCKCCESHANVKVAMIRASGFELRNIFPGWFSGLAAKEIISHEQSESEGNVTITVFYR